MRRLIPILFMMWLPLTGLAEDSDTDECSYDPAAFTQMLEQLHGQYVGSRYTKDKGALEIFLEDGTVTVSYGGCEHYGTEINYLSKEKKAYSTRQSLNKAVELVGQFGQERIDMGKLWKVIRQRKYEKIGPGLFSVAYPEMDEFIVRTGRKSGQPTIAISFYN